MQEVPPDLEKSERTHKTSARLSNYFSRLLDRQQPSSQFVLVVTALIVGIGAGIGAVIFRYLINAVTWIGFDSSGFSISKNQT